MPKPQRHTVLPAAIAAWATYLAFDFLIHAVFISPWWRATERYWLPPRDLLRLIPYGYASFAIYCAALTWLIIRFYGGRPSPSAGFRFGVLAGLVWGAGICPGELLCISDTIIRSVGLARVNRNRIGDRGDGSGRGRRR